MAWGGPELIPMELRIDERALHIKNVSDHTSSAYCTAQTGCQFHFAFFLIYPGNENPVVASVAISKKHDELTEDWRRI